MFYRTGYSDPRWPSQPYGSGYMPTHGHTYPYSQPQSHTGYGSGYSYGYNDVRRSGSVPTITSHPYASGYGSYQRHYPPSTYKYGQVVPYQHAVHGSQYYSSPQYYPSSSQYYASPPASNRWWAPSSVINPYPTSYPYPGVSQYAPRTGPLMEPLVDPHIAQQQNYLFPFGRHGLPREGHAVMRGHPTSAVSGTIEFCQVGPGSVRVKGRMTGLPGPSGNRGLHILKDSACPPLDQFPVDSKALEHFNPFNAAHGSRDSANKHVGDLSNIFLQFDGSANIDFTVNQLSLDDPLYSIANHSIVITEREDDLGLNQNAESRLRGNAGRAIACGVIGVRAPLPPPFQSSSPFLEDPFSRRPDYYGPFPPQNYPFLQ